MKRRSFLKTAAAATATAPFMIGGLQARANTSLEALAQLPVDNDRILIVIQLFGGNDGLNMLPPVDDDEYYRIRPKLAVKQEDAWNYLNRFYLHPTLALGPRGGVARMLEQGTLSIVRGVGYDNPNLSHFRSTDIWLSGINNSDPNVRLDTGWVGRFLEHRYPDFPLSLPDHPLAVQFGGFSLALLSSKGRMGIEVTDPSLQRGLTPQLDALDPESAGTAYEVEYEFVADIASRSNKYALAVKNAYAAGKPRIGLDYRNDGFGNQLASVAALIAGGLQTKVYVVSMGGFDTHVTQQHDALTGTHPVLLQRLSEGISQFTYDMIRLGYGDRVMGLTVSEFGRRPYENGSLGTDHGASSVQFVFGTMVNSGIFGTAFDLKNLNANGDLNYSIDYREVYAEILGDWFGMTQTEVAAVLQDETLIPLDVIQGQPTGITDRGVAAAGFSVNAYPNPFVASTTIEITLPVRAHANLEIVTPHGRRIATLVDRTLEAGRHRVPFSADIPAGSYIAVLRTAERTTARPVQCLR